MLQVHRSDSLGNTTGFIIINRKGAASLYSTKTTGTRAGVSMDHERGSAGIPTFSDVWTAGFLTYRV
jgi:hypothetical protein